jgi:hypothetical protein
VAENALAFLGSIGLLLAGHTESLSHSADTVLTATSLASMWQGGISPGDWQALGYHTGSTLRGRQFSAVDSFASLWFRGSGKKESDFAKLTRELVELKNNFKHDRAPKTPDEFEKAVARMRASLNHLYS